MEIPMQNLNLNDRRGSTKEETLSNIKRRIRTLEDKIEKYERLLDNNQRLSFHYHHTGNIEGQDIQRRRYHGILRIIRILTVEKQDLEKQKRKIEHFQMLTKGKVTGKGRKKKLTQKKAKTKK